MSVTLLTTLAIIELSGDIAINTTVRLSELLSQSVNLEAVCHTVRNSKLTIHDDRCRWFYLPIHRRKTWSIFEIECRIIRGPKQDQAVRRGSSSTVLPLSEFSKEKRGESPVYLLAGFRDVNTKLRVAISAQNAAPVWFNATSPGEMNGIREAKLPASAGQCFITIAIDSQPALTLSCFAYPNRCTLITLTTDEDGQPRVGQFLLPIRHLTRYLPDEVRSNFESRYRIPPSPRSIKDVQVLALLSRAFRKRRNIRNEFKNHELDDLLYCKWLDPIGASLASYECLRRGEKKLARKVFPNMNLVFPELPDTPALDRLTSRAKVPNNGVPLFLDGLRAFEDYPKWLPFPAGLLDYSSVWTSWRGAIIDPEAR